VIFENKVEEVDWIQARGDLEVDWQNSLSESSRLAGQNRNRAVDWIGGNIAG